MEIPRRSVLEEFLQANYPVGAEFSIQRIEKGEENLNFHVITSGAEYVLRIYSTHQSTTGLRSQHEIEFELDFMAAAHNQGVPTPPVIPTKSGRRIAAITVEKQSRYAVLFAYAQGDEPEAYTGKIARSTAAVLLVLRRASLAFHRPGPRPWPGDIIRLSLDYYAANRAQISQHRSLLDGLYETAARGYRQVQEAHLPKGIIHGDVKLGNLLFDGGRVSAVIDFDDYRHSYLLEEFTRTVMHDLDSPTRNAIRAGFFSVLRDAFAADPTVTDTEMAHLSTFLKARLVYDLTTYALSGFAGLVEEVLSDAHIQEVILFTP